jgi:hypothetical protein
MSTAGRRLARAERGRRFPSRTSTGTQRQGRAQRGRSINESNSYGASPQGRAGRGPQPAPAGWGGRSEAVVYPRSAGGRANARPACGELRLALHEVDLSDGGMRWYPGRQPRRGGRRASACRRRRGWQAGFRMPPSDRSTPCNDNQEAPRAALTRHPSLLTQAGDPGCVRAGPRISVHRRPRSAGACCNRPQRFDSVIDALAPLGLAFYPQ